MGSTIAKADVQKGRGRAGPVAGQGARWEKGDSQCEVTVVVPRQWKGLVDVRGRSGRSLRHRAGGAQVIGLALLGEWSAARLGADFRSRPSLPKFA